MSDERTRRLVAALSRAGGWRTAAELAADLGVSPRSVRSWVQSARSEDPGVVDASSSGYRLGRDRAAGAHERDDSPATPAARATAMLRRLLEEDGGLDAHEVAAAAFVSESTVESDLARIRARLDGSGLRLERVGARVRILGPESARRRLIGALFRDEMVRGVVELDRVTAHFATASLGAFKTALLAGLDDAGYQVNEYGIGDVLLHLAIAVDRVGRGAALGDDQADGSALADLPIDLDALVTRHFGVALGAGDLSYVAFLLSTRVVTPSGDPASDGSGFIGGDLYERVRGIVVAAGAEYLIDLDDREFLVRLSAHVQNLLRRAADGAYSRNPLTRAIKSSHPMVYELAVNIVGRLQEATTLEATDDEIAYVAMHVGAHLERSLRADARITATLVAPRYHDTHELLAERIARAAGDELDITAVVTRADVDWDAIATDLVIATIEPPRASEHVLVVQPFPSRTELDAVRAAAGRARRSRARSALMAQLGEYLRPELFVRDLRAGSAEEAIRDLGARMVALGVVDEAYVDSALERERLSSTAFTDALAMPHAMTMSANETSIAIAVTDRGIPWGDARVQVVAFIAFSAAGRARFQSVFDQFVEIFSDRAAVQSLVRGGTDYPSFLARLVALFDD